MSHFLEHPLVVALIPAAVVGVLVQKAAQQWQERQKTLDVLVSLVTDMSEAAMGLIARLETVLDLEELDDRHGADMLLKELKDKPYDFQVRKAVAATKLEAYLKGSTIPHRWDTLAKAMTKFVALKQPNGAQQHRDRLVDELKEAMTELVECERSNNARDAKSPEDDVQQVRNAVDRLRPSPKSVDPLAWRDVLKAIRARKGVLIDEVRHTRRVFHTSWLIAIRTRIRS
jgi:hypothetical protein